MLVDDAMWKRKSCQHAYSWLPNYDWFRLVCLPVLFSSLLLEMHGRINASQLALWWKFRLNIINLQKTSIFKSICSRIDPTLDQTYKGESIKSWKQPICFQIEIPPTNRNKISFNFVPFIVHTNFVDELTPYRTSVVNSYNQNHWILAKTPTSVEHQFESRSFRSSNFVHCFKNKNSKHCKQLFIIF